MLLKEVFSKIYKESFTKENPTWEREYNYENEDLLKEIDLHFQFEIRNLFTINNESERTIKILNEHFDQIIERKNSPNSTPLEKEFFYYIQFISGLSTITQLNYDGEFIYCFGIFMRSVFDKTYKNGEVYDLKDIKIFKLLNSKSDYLSNCYPVIEQWFSQLYYYSKSFSGLNDWCEYYFEDIFYELNENLNIEEYHPQFLSNLLSWCEVALKKIESNAVRKIIQREYDAIDWSDNFNKNKIKSGLGIQLILCKNYENDNKNKILQEIENNIDIHAGIKMQAIIALCFDEVSLDANYSLLIDSIRSFNEYIKIEYPNNIDSTYQRARIFKSLLNGIISLTIELGKGKIIDEILTSYYTITEPYEEGIIYIITNLKEKVTYCLPEESIFDQKDSQKIIVNLIEIENKVFNSFRLLKGGFTKKIIPTEKPIGFPESKYSKIYENKLNELYNFDLLRDKLINIGSLIQFDFNSTPIQTLMLRNIGITLPLNLSLSKKLDFPETKNVLFWSGNSLTSEIETISLKEIFSSQEINFEIHNESNSNLENFINQIDILNPEIIWISSHGQHEHYEPNSSQIHLSNEISIKIRDFHLLKNKNKKRRLLFFNVCEGGTHAQTGEFKNIGFPNLLTSENQDVISHLWMVDSNFAYIFGILFSIGVCFHKKNFFESYCYSLLVIMRGKESILNNLNELPLELSELKDRIINNDRTEWKNLVTIGSPVYHI
ncbi:hypothetical protein [Polaribacter sp. OB-PA-B3]